MAVARQDGVSHHPQCVLVTGMVWMHHGQAVNNGGHQQRITCNALHRRQEKSVDRKASSPRIPRLGRKKLPQALVFDVRRVSIEPWSNLPAAQTGATSGMTEWTTAAFSQKVLNAPASGGACATKMSAVVSIRILRACRVLRLPRNCCPTSNSASAAPRRSCACVHGCQVYDSSIGYHSPKPRNARCP